MTDTLDSVREEPEGPPINTDTDMGQDDDTVVTGEKRTLTGAEWKEMTILIEMTYKDNNEARTSPQKHMMILKAMGDAFDNTELTLFDNKNRKLSLEACREMTNLDHYESHFKIHQGKGRHYVIFRVHATIGFQSLKRHSDVLNTLKKTNCYLKRHHWPEDKWDIVNLGFILQMDPGRHMAEEVREHMIELAKTKECVTVSGSRFKLVAQRFKIKHNGKNTNADAYGVQCMRIDAQSVDTMMKTMHRDTLTYVKSKLRKDQPKAFVSALRVQNKYITNVKTIPLVGITRTTMTDIRPILLAEENIQYVAATRHIDSIGRWDIITDDAHRLSVTKMIQENLSTWLETASTDLDHPEDFPDPGIKVRTTAFREDSSQGDISYLSTSAGSYDSMIEKEDDNNYNEAPTKSRNTISLSGFSWAEVAARNPQTPASRTSTNVSELTGATHAQPHQEEIKELKETMKAMAEQITQLTALIAKQMIAAPIQPQGGYYPPQPPPPFHPMPHQYNHWTASQQQSTPNRHNVRNPGGRGGQDDHTKRNINPKTKASKATQPTDVEPPTKRIDDKRTPTKETQLQIQAPPELQQTRTESHPYETARMLQYEHAGMHPQYAAYNYSGPQQPFYPPYPPIHSPNRGRQDPRENSPYFMTQQNEAAYGPSTDLAMQAHHHQSHLAVDAMNYASL
jgi:hypothetical protein